MEAIRRAAVSARNFASGGGHGDLSAAISEQKVVLETSLKLLTANTDASVYTYKWARSETNKATQQVFHKMCGLTTLWSESQREFAQKYKKYRATFKEIRQDEKALDDARKHEGSCATKLAKLKKQMDAAKKKNDSGKVDVLMPELKQAVSAYDKASEELAERTDHNEATKAANLRESLIAISNAHIQMGERMQDIFTAQRKLAELISPETVPNSDTAPNDKLYAGISKKSDGIFQALCQQLGLELPPLPGEKRPTLKTYIQNRQSPGPRAQFPPPPSKSPPPIYAQPEIPPEVSRRSSVTFMEPLACEYVEPDEEPPQRKGRGVSVLSDGYSRPGDMYDWIWQRQSKILGTASGEYTRVYDDQVPEGGSPKVGRQAKESPKMAKKNKGSPKISRKKESPKEGSHRKGIPNAKSEEDRSGYLLPREVMGAGSSREDSVANGSDVQPATAKIEIEETKGEYAYARVVTTCALPPSKKHADGGGGIARMPVKERRVPPPVPQPFANTRRPVGRPRTHAISIVPDETDDIAYKKTGGREMENPT